MTGWSDPDRWEYRRRINKVDGVGDIKIGSPNYHFTELDGVTPVEMVAVEEVVDGGVVLWVKPSDPEKGFYIYYDAPYRSLASTPKGREE